MKTFNKTKFYKECCRKDQEQGKMVRLINILTRFTNKISKKHFSKTKYYYIAKARNEERKKLEKWWRNLSKPTIQESAYYAAWPRQGPRMRILGYHEPVSLINWEFNPPIRNVVAETWSKEEWKDTIDYLDSWPR